MNLSKAYLPAAAALAIWLTACNADVTRKADNLFKAGKHREAIAAYDKYLITKPRDIKSLYNRGRAYEDLGELEKAKDDFLKVLDIDRENIKANLSMGQYCYDKEEYNKAQAFLDKVIAIDGRVSNAWLLKGRCYHQQGDFKEAQKNYNLAIDLNPKNAIAFLYRGALKIAMNRKKSACNDLHRAKALGAKGADNALVKYCK